MNDNLRNSIINKIKEKSDFYSFEHCKEQASLNFCEILLKRCSGYAVSYTEGKLLASMPEMINRNMKPSKLALRFLCSVYYKHSNLKPDGCVWGNKFKD